MEWKCNPQTTWWRGNDWWWSVTSVEEYSCCWHGRYATGLKKLPISCLGTHLAASWWSWCETPWGGQRRGGHYCMPHWRCNWGFHQCFPRPGMASSERLRLCDPPPLRPHPLLFLQLNWLKHLEQFQLQLPLLDQLYQPLVNPQCHPVNFLQPRLMWFLYPQFWIITEPIKMSVMKYPGLWMIIVVCFRVSGGMSTVSTLKEMWKFIIHYDKCGEWDNEETQGWSREFILNVSSSSRMKKTLCQSV